MILDFSSSSGLVREIFQTILKAFQSNLKCKKANSCLLLAQRFLINMKLLKSAVASNTTLREPVNTTLVFLLNPEEWATQPEANEKNTYEHGILLQKTRKKTKIKTTKPLLLTRSPTPPILTMIIMPKDQTPITILKNWATI